MEMVPDCGENFGEKPVVNGITETVRFCAGSVRSFRQGDVLEFSGPLGVRGEIHVCCTTMK